MNGIERRAKRKESDEEKNRRERIIRLYSGTICRSIFEMLLLAAAEKRHKPFTLEAIVNYLDANYDSPKHSGQMFKDFGISKMENIVEAQLVAVFKSQANLLGGKDYRRAIGVAEALRRIQPRMTGISSKKLSMQQYSTPLTLAARLGFFVRLGLCDSRVEIPGKRESIPDWYCFEPTAGNGMLSAFIPPGNLVANELDPDRFQEFTNILREVEYSQGGPCNSGLEAFKGYRNVAKVYNQDALSEDLYKEACGGTIRRCFRAMLLNPPFATLGTPTTFDGCRISKMEHLIALKSLRLLHPQGRAALIIGGKAKYDQYGILRTITESPFIRYLYSHYVVQANVTFSGKSYAVQGANFPFRVILINGVRETPDKGVLPPTQREDPYYDHPAIDFAELDQYIVPLISVWDTSDGKNRLLLDDRNNLRFVRTAMEAHKKMFA